MQLSAKGARFIHLLEEGTEPALKTYKCQAGILTIGWGHTSAAGEPRVVEGMEITREDADLIFDNDIAPVVSQLNQMLQNAGLTITQPQFDALVSFSFNLGVETLRTSTAWTWIHGWNLGGCKHVPPTSVAAAICQFVKLVNPDTGQKIIHPDLADRRYKEARLFVEGIYGKGID